MTPTQLRQNIENARRELLGALSVEGATVGADAAALVEQRIVEKGTNKDGVKLSPYSTKEVPAYLYFGRSRNAGGEAAVRRKAKERQPVSYSEFRQLNGLNTNVKSLQFTGEMWQGFGVTAVRQIGTGVVEVTIGGKNARTASLLGYHSTREGTQITEPSADELKLVTAAMNKRLVQIIQRNLG